MKAAIFFATREGHTRLIAEHIALALSAEHIHAAMFDVKVEHRMLHWPGYDRVFLLASVHAGHHEPEMIAFVKAHRAQLERLSAAFVSVTLSEAGAEDPLAPPERRAEAARDAQRMVDVFVEETGWRPAHVLRVAGALAYSRYNFIVRAVLKHIARKAHAPTDTSRDYEFTDWNAVDGFVRQLSRVCDTEAATS